MSFIQPDADRSDLTHAARSRPVALRFKETRPRFWYFDLRCVSTFYGDRELCWQYLEPEIRRRVYGFTVFNEPVPVLAMPELDETGLTARLYAEIESPESYETPGVRFPLGCRVVRWTDMRYPDDPARETRYLLQRLLQGSPEGEVEDLVRSVTRQASGREA